MACSQPEGAIFCNGQYVNASDIGACIQWLLTNKDIEVNVEAQGSSLVWLLGVWQHGHVKLGEEDA